MLHPKGYDPSTVQTVVNFYIVCVTLATSLHCTNITFMHMPISSVTLPGKTFFFFFYHLPQILCSDVLITVVLRNIFK